MHNVPEIAAEPALVKEFVFTGDLGSMPAARDAMMGFIHEYCASPQEEQEEVDSLVALQEALANAVLHGCHNDPSKTIHCSVEIDSSAIAIVISDPGPGFDVDAATGSNGKGSNLTEHGRGISLMRGLMDEVSYGRGGSEVRLKKLRAIVPAVTPRFASPAP